MSDMKFRTAEVRAEKSFMPGIFGIFNNLVGDPGCPVCGRDTARSFSVVPFLDEYNAYFPAPYFSRCEDCHRKAEEAFLVGINYEELPLYIRHPWIFKTSYDMYLKRLQGLNSQEETVP